MRDHGYEEHDSCHAATTFPGTAELCGLRGAFFFGEMSFLWGAEAVLAGGMLGAPCVQIHCN